MNQTKYIKYNDKAFNETFSNDSPQQVEKALQNTSCKLHLASETAAQSCFVRKLFLKISQSSQKNTCSCISF